MKKIFNAITYTLLCPIIGLALACSEVRTNEQTEAAASKVAPDFALNDLNQQAFSLTSQRGKIVMLNFWATWCKPCRQEIPEMVKLHTNYRDKGVIVWGIAINSSDIAVDLWVENFHMTYPVLVATKEDQKIVEAYGADQGIPFSVLIDPDGRIYKEYRGVPENFDIFSQDIDHLLAMNL